MSAAVTPLPHYAFMACIGTTLLYLILNTWSWATPLPFINSTQWALHGPRAMTFNVFWTEVITLPLAISDTLQNVSFHLRSEVHHLQRGQRIISRFWRKHKNLMYAGSHTYMTVYTSVLNIFQVWKFASYLYSPYHTQKKIWLHDWQTQTIISKIKPVCDFCHCSKKGIN